VQSTRSGPPAEPPIGLALATASKAVERAFDDALAAAGGSRPTWLILLAIVSGAGTTQTELAERVGITGPTLVHHLDRLEAAGLLNRHHDPDNRRIRRLSLTAAGKRAFLHLREAAAGFDARLRRGLTATDVATLRRLLAAVSENAVPSDRNSSTKEKR
jgi:MarR family transcriptional regulator for hemolysin